MCILPLADELSNLKCEIKVINDKATKPQCAFALPAFLAQRRE